MISILHFYAYDDEELEAKLNELVGSGRLISVKHIHDNRYEIIVQTTS